MESYGRSSVSYNKSREPWSLGGADHPLARGLPWPPRAYICSFCKRQFRSAQALGGHMNVHRRDRARLRGSPPLDPPSPNPNPNRVPNLNSPPLSLLHHTSTPVARHVRYSSSSSLTSSDDLKASNAVKDSSGVKELKVLMERDCGGVGKEKREVVRLDLEMGMCGYMKEELDLELRLGYTETQALCFEIC